MRWLLWIWSLPSQINASCGGKICAGKPLRHGGTVALPIATASPSPLGPPMLHMRAALNRFGSSSPARVFAPAGASNVSQNAACSRPQPGGPGGYTVPVPPLAAPAFELPPLALSPASPLPAAPLELPPVPMLDLP